MNDFVVVAIFVGLTTFGAIVASCLVILFWTREEKK